jgi:hypothetical protein
MTEWTKIPMDARAEKAVIAFHKEHAQKLQAMAENLRAAGIARVHFGLDYNNDEPDLSDYGVIEYADGRTEEIGEWYAALDEDVFWAFPTGTGTYTFDAASAQVSEDQQGGVIDVYEGVSRAFHSRARRSELEVEASEAAAEVEEFMREYADDSDRTT